MIKKRNREYIKFERRLFGIIILISGITLLTLLSLTSFLSGRLGNWVVGFLQNIFRFSYEDAYYFHDHYIRGNKSILLFITAIILAWLFLRILIGFMTKYFDEISRGLDELVEETDSKIELSEEMNFLEYRMNYCKDILRKRSKEIKVSEERKNDLVVYLAHDIRTPLTSIIGYLNVLEENLDLPIEMREKYIGITLNKAYRLESLINQFFDITRFSLQDIEILEADIDISLMLYQIVDEFYPVLRKEKKDIKIEMDEIIIKGDSDKLARVFNNILKNAIAYSYEDTNIIIESKVLGDSLVIDISNEGPTISERDLETIFDKFYRLDSSRSTSTGGSGLGLAIAKEIVLAHRGSIEVESKDEITRFRVKLPLENKNLV